LRVADRVVFRGEHSSDTDDYNDSYAYHDADRHASTNSHSHSDGCIHAYINADSDTDTKPDTAP
jgi:hypothetical protein